MGPLSSDSLPPGIRSRIVAGVNGLDVHVLEAGERADARGTLLALHGFPELAFCWRRLMPLLASEGWHVVAPDQRGYGRTTPAPVDYEDDLAPVRALNLAGDMVHLLSALGVERVAAVIGHDFGAPVAGLCALARSDRFARLVLLTPFAPPAAGVPGRPALAHDPVAAALGELSPPRKHYQLYYSGREAGAHMHGAPQGLAAFLRGYYHQKSADWPHNAPAPLRDWSADALAGLPHYYVMPAGATMADVAAADMPPAGEHCDWLTDAELAFVAAEFERTGFQGGLNWYRNNTSGANQRDLALFAGATVERVMFVGGRADWGAHQFPGALDAMRTRLGRREVPVQFIEGAGHWVQQERPHEVAAAILHFLDA